MTRFRHFRRFAISGIIFVTIACTTPESSVVATPSSNPVTPGDFANPNSFWDVSEASGITRNSAFEDAKFKLHDLLRRDLVASVEVIDGYGMNVFETWPHCKAAITAKLALSGIIASQSAEEAGTHTEVATLALGYLADIISDPVRITTDILPSTESILRCHDFEDQRQTED